MSMFNTGDILETIEMFTQDNLDVRTVTMGISLLDCIDPDPKKACENIYNKITTKAANLVPTVEHISAEYGIPIINKRISVTPIAMLLGACPDADPVEFAKTLDAAGKKVGVNFVGGYSALVHKGFSAGDRRLIESIPRALAETDIVCSSVNIGATKAGLNMDAVKLMGEAVKKASELTAGRQCIGAAKLVVFCNAPEDNPFMAGAFHGPGEPDCEIHVGVSGPGAVRAALARLPKDAPIDEVAELVKRTAFKITRVGQLVANLASQALGVPAGIIDLSLAPTPAIGDSVANILEEMGLETCGDEQAIKVFGKNAKQLLLGAPLKGLTVLGFDPAYRTGCKLAVIDETGKVLDTVVVYPTEPQNDIEGAKKELIRLIVKDKINMIAIGNGTASRESEMFVSDTIKEVKEKLGLDVYYAIVSEAGASVYSASKLATEEYPDLNVSLRGAISIARRLQDPLAEFVKIDPKAIGIGQYQHDVDQKKLTESLGGVVEDAVNEIGVDVNTATPSLLSYVSGINSGIAKNIVKYREENGKFTERKQLLKVPKLGKVAFEQCAGFIRIPDGKNPLEITAVHPESYAATEKLLDRKSTRLNSSH